MSSTTNNSDPPNTRNNNADNERCTQYHNQLVDDFVEITTENIRKRVKELCYIINQNKYILSSNNTLNSMNNTNCNAIQFNLDITNYVNIAMESIKPVIQNHTVVQLNSCKKIPKSLNEYKKVARNRLNRNKPKFVGNFVFAPIIFDQLYQFCGDIYGNNQMVVFVSILEDILSPHAVVRFEQTRAQPLIPYNTLVMENKFKNACITLLKHYKLAKQWEIGSKKQNGKKETAKDIWHCFRTVCLPKLAERCRNFDNLTLPKQLIINTIKYTSQVPIIPDTPKCNDNTNEYMMMDQDVVEEYKQNQSVHSKLPVIPPSVDMTAWNEQYQQQQTNDTMVSMKNYDNNSNNNGLSGGYYQEYGERYNQYNAPQYTPKTTTTMPPNNSNTDRCSPHFIPSYQSDGACNNYSVHTASNNSYSVHTPSNNNCNACRSQINNNNNTYSVHNNTSNQLPPISNIPPPVQQSVFIPQFPPQITTNNGNMYNNNNNNYNTNNNPNCNANFSGTGGVEHMSMNNNNNNNIPNINNNDTYFNNYNNTNNNNDNNRNDPMIYTDFNQNHHQMVYNECNQNNDANFQFHDENNDVTNTADIDDPINKNEFQLQSMMDDDCFPMNNMMVSSPMDIMSVCYPMTSLSRKTSATTNYTNTTNNSWGTYNSPNLPNTDLDYNYNSNPSNFSPSVFTTFNQ